MLSLDQGHARMHRHGQVHAASAAEPVKARLIRLLPGPGRG